MTFRMRAKTLTSFSPRIRRSVPEEGEDVKWSQARTRLFRQHHQIFNVSTSVFLTLTRTLCVGKCFWDWQTLTIPFMLPIMLYKMFMVITILPLWLYHPLLRPLHFMYPKHFHLLLPFLLFLVVVVYPLLQVERLVEMTLRY